MRNEPLPTLFILVGAPSVSDAQWDGEPAVVHWEDETANQGTHERRGQVNGFQDKGVEGLVSWKATAEPG